MMQINLERKPNYTLILHFIYSMLENYRLQLQQNYYIHRTSQPLDSYRLQHQLQLNVRFSSLFFRSKNHNFSHCFQLLLFSIHSFTFLSISNYNRFLIYVKHKHRSIHSSQHIVQSRQITTITTQW